MISHWASWPMHEEGTLKALQLEDKTMAEERAAAVANPEGTLKCFLPLRNLQNDHKQSI